MQRQVQLLVLTANIPALTIKPVLLAAKAVEKSGQGSHLGFCNTQRSLCHLLQWFGMLWQRGICIELELSRKSRPVHIPAMNYICGWRCSERAEYVHIKKIRKI